jgi:hypothetical protein
MCPLQPPRYVLRRLALSPHHLFGMFSAGLVLYTHKTCSSASSIHFWSCLIPSSFIYEVDLVLHLYLSSPASHAGSLLLSSPASYICSWLTYPRQPLRYFLGLVVLPSPLKIGPNLSSIASWEFLGWSCPPDFLEFFSWQLGLPEHLGNVLRLMPYGLLCSFQAICNNL